MYKPRTPALTARSLLSYVLCGLCAGAAAAALLVALTPLRALVGLLALGAGFFTLASPAFGLLVLTAGTIAVWPDQLIKLLGVAVTGSVLLWAMAERRPLTPRCWLVALQALLAGLMWLAAARVPSYEARLVALNYTGYAVLSWTFLLAANERIVRRLVAAMLISGVVLALIGIYQRYRPFVWVVSASRTAAENPLSGATALEELHHGSTLRIESIAGTPNYLAMSMHILLPFALFWAVRRRALAGRALGAGLVALLVLVMGLTLTRGVALTTALITVPLFVYKFGVRRALPYLAAGLLLAIPVVGLLEPLRERIVDLVTEFFSRSGPSWSTSGGWRSAVLPLALKMFRDHFWLGAGLGQQHELWRSYAPTDVVMPGTEETLPIHNAYLQMAVDLGVAGLALMVALLAAGWWAMQRAQSRFARAGQQPLWDIAAAAQIALAGMAANYMMYPGLGTYRYFWVLVALVVAIAQVARAQGPAGATEAARG